MVFILNFNPTLTVAISTNLKINFCAQSKIYKCWLQSVSTFQVFLNIKAITKNVRKLINRYHFQAILSLLLITHSK